MSDGLMDGRMGGWVHGEKDGQMDKYTHVIQVPPEWHVSYNLFQYNTVLFIDTKKRS
jgi:hypothetical protein